jgi:hypothetical protein
MLLIVLFHCFITVLYFEFIQFINTSLNLCYAVIIIINNGIISIRAPPLE